MKILQPPERGARQACPLDDATSPTTTSIDPARRDCAAHLRQWASCCYPRRATRRRDVNCARATSHCASPGLGLQLPAPTLSSCNSLPRPAPPCPRLPAIRLNG